VNHCVARAGLAIDALVIVFFWGEITEVIAEEMKSGLKRAQVQGVVCVG